MTDAEFRPEPEGNRSPEGSASPEESGSPPGSDPPRGSHSPEEPRASRSTGPRNVGQRARELAARARASVGRAIRRAPSALVDASSAVLRAGHSYLWAPAVAAIAAGSVHWFLRDRASRLKLLGSNKLGFEQQLAAAKGPAVALGIVGALVLLSLVARRLVRGRFDGALVGKATRDLLLFPMAAPFVLGLFQPGIERESPKLALLFSVGAAALVGTAVYRLRALWEPAPSGSSAEPAADGPTRSRAREVASSVLAAAAVLAIGVAYGWFFSRLAITNHHALVTRTIDLGIYDNIFWQSSHGKPLGCTFVKAGYHGSAHFDPILVLISPLYRLYPRAEFLLVLQSAWIALGVVPVYLLAKHFLRSRAAGVVLAACYALHPALHGANLYEFHSLTLATVPILFTLYFLATDRRVLYFVALAVALLVREDIPLMLAMVGVATMLRPEGKQRGLGLATIVVCATYFVVVKKVFMTSSGVIMSGPEAYSFAYYYEELIAPGQGVAGLALSLVTNPVFVLTHVFEEAKLVFLAVVFLPMLALPFLARIGRLTLLYGLALCLLASRTAVFSTHFQYTNTLLPFAFALVPEAIASLRDGRVTRALELRPRSLVSGVCAAMLVASLGISFKFGGIVDNQSFKGGFQRVARRLSNEQIDAYTWLRAAIAKIPRDASVGVTNKLGPHVSNRRHVYFYGQRGTDFVLLDEKELKADRQKRHRAALDAGRLTEVTRHGSLVLFRSQRPAPKTEQPAPAKSAAPPGLEPPEAPSGQDDLDERIDDVLGDEPRE
jgi:uncharacterized membrane protein